MNSRRVVLYISCSLDGFIAKPDDDLSFLDAIHREGEDYGYNAFVQDVDTVIIGRRTYLWVHQQTGAYPHVDKNVFVVTRKKEGVDGNVTYWPGSLRTLIDDLKQKPGGTIYCDGGAAVANEMLRHDCLDEIVVSIIPTLLGDGLRLFHRRIPERTLELISSKSFDSGLVQLHYRIQKAGQTV